MGNRVLFDEKLCYSEDQDFLLKAFSVSNNIATLGKVLYFYHDVASSAVNKQVTRRRAFSQLVVISNLLSFIKSEERYHAHVIKKLIYDYFYYGRMVVGYSRTERSHDFQKFTDGLENQNKIIKGLKKVVVSANKNTRLFLLTVLINHKVGNKKRKFIRMINKFLF